MSRKAPRTRVWALVEWAERRAVHVALSLPGGNVRRWPVPWERIDRHWPGRQEYDRHC